MSKRPTVRVWAFAALLLALIGAVVCYAPAPSVPPFVGPTVTTLLAWAVLAFQFLGLGTLALRVVGPTEEVGRCPFAAFWVGLALVLAWLQIWSFFLPVTWQALVLPTAVACVGWKLARSSVHSTIRCAARRSQVIVGVGALALWGALSAQAPLEVYDAGLYHLPAIRWASTYAVVPGLGNLNPAFGLGSSFFLYLASVSVGGVHGFHIGIGLLLVVLLLELWVAAMRRPASVSSLFAALLIMPTLVFIGMAGLSTTMYDAGSYVLSIAVARYLLLHLENVQRFSRREALTAVFVISALGFAAITVKISNAVFCGACIALVLGISVKRPDWRWSHALTVGAVVSGLAILLLGPWLTRNVILTGYPLYPLPLFGLPFEWSMPAATVRNYRDVLSDFARVHGPGFAGAGSTLAWFSRWLWMSWRDVGPEAVVAVGAPAGMLLFARRQVMRCGPKWLLLIPVWIGLLGWWVSSPDPRYAMALFALASALPLAFWLISAPRRLALAIGMLFVAAIEMPSAPYLVTLLQPSTDVVRGLTAETPDVPIPSLTSVTTNSGLRVYTPADGTDQVWDAPLPASGTPPNPALRTRCPDSLACGFRVQ